MSLEDQIKLHKSLSIKIKELEEQKKTLGVSIMQAMQGKTLQLGGYLVKCYSRLSIKLSVEEARPYNAVKLEETVDKDKIKTLYKQGRVIKGVSESQFIIVSTLAEVPEECPF